MRNKILVLVVFLIGLKGYSQEDIHLTKNIKLVESFVAKNYQVPESIFFNFQGHDEFSFFYKELSKLVKRKIKNKINKYTIEIDVSSENPLEINSFDEIYLYNNRNYEAECVLSIGQVSAFYPDESQVATDRIVMFDLYMILQETSTKTILLKKKFNVKSRYTMLSQNGKLSTEIVKQILSKKN